MSEETKTDGPELVEITIDGRAYQAPKGVNLLQFMLDQGIEVSYFCYQPRLPIAAVCRQCLVGLSNVPKLVPACQTMVGGPMEVDNSSDKVLRARRQLLELQLINHPVDCPICDQAGECTLQKHYMDWNHGGSRIDHAKLGNHKKKPVGPRIKLDNERCILCTRCVRFCRDVYGEMQLVVSKRGDHSTIDTAPGKQLDNPYSLNVVDLCPVGALTQQDFRFARRVWELSKTDSVCAGCATGCGVEIDHADGTIYRLVTPRDQNGESLNWLCDHGRSIYKQVSDEKRPRLPELHNDKKGWDEALAEVGEKLAKLSGADRSTIGVVLGADATNEDNYVAARLALDFLETDKLYLAALPMGDEGDDFLRDDDPNPNRKGATACGRDKLRTTEELVKDLAEGKLKALYVVGDTLTLPEEALSEASRLQLFVVQATSRSELTRRAQVVLPAAMWPEVNGTLTNREGETQRLHAAVEPPDFARPHWQILCQVARKAGLTLDYTSAREIFNAMRDEVALFEGTEWGRDLPPVLLRFAGSRG
jgi:NADH-quinone oxidoreductase subunit G